MRRVFVAAPSLEPASRLSSPARDIFDAVTNSDSFCFCYPGGLDVIVDLVLDW